MLTQYMNNRIYPLSHIFPKIMFMSAVPGIVYKSDNAIRKRVDIFDYFGHQAVLFR